MNSRKSASQVGSVIACTSFFFFLTYLFSTIESPQAFPPPLTSSFRAALDIPPQLLSQPLQYSMLFIQGIVTLASEDVLGALWGSPELTPPVLFLLMQNSGSQQVEVSTNNCTLWDRQSQAAG